MTDHNTSAKRFCLHCDDGTLLAYGAKDLAVTSGNLSEVIPSVLGWHCPVCADVEFADGHGQRYAQAVSALQVLAGKQRAAQIRATRKRLGLRQAEAGRLFGGGASAFSEYERGKTQPHKSTVLLLKLLDKHPALLAELKAG